jgi:predicted short-subunit dehydrogenase-like oxidoreductase (DUF2520 family)
MGAKKQIEKNLKSFVLIGSGNVASSLGKALCKKGFVCLQVWSRNPKNAKILAKQLHAEAISEFYELNTTADFIFLAVSDDAIASVSATIPASGAIVVHTSGTANLEDIATHHKKTAVLYPLQTIRKNAKTAWKKIPILIEGKTKSDRQAVQHVAEKLSANVIFMNSEQRKRIHLAAVLSCNFTNHFLHLAEQQLKKVKQPLALLKPLITTTVENALMGDAGKKQTGPAKRGDKKTMQAHLALLKGETELQKMYQLISSSIQHEKE